MSREEVVLYGRDGCCLCDDARVVLERVRAQHPFALTEVDIEHDERLLRAYLETSGTPPERIPRARALA